MTRPWFPPVPILEVGRAVERSSKASDSERMRFHEQVDALVGGRFAIRLINGRYEIWDADSHDVFGNYRTYDDAFHAAEKLL